MIQRLSKRRRWPKKRRGGRAWHSRIELFVLYGMFMLLLGIGLGQLFSSDEVEPDAPMVDAYPPGVDREAYLSAIPQELPNEAASEETSGDVVEDKAGDALFPEILKDDIDSRPEAVALEGASAPVAAVGVVQPSGEEAEAEDVPDQKPPAALTSIEQELEMEALSVVPVPKKKPLVDDVLLVVPVLRPVPEEGGEAAEEEVAADVAATEDASAVPPEEEAATEDETSEEVVTSEEEERAQEEKLADVPAEEGGVIRDYELDMVVEKGATFNSMMLEAGLDGGQAAEVLSALKKVFNPRTLQIDQVLNLTLQENRENGEISLKKLMIDDADELIQVVAEGDGFIATREAKKLTVKPKSAKGLITSSLYGLASELGVPDAVMAELVNKLGFVVDFQRDIQSGAQMELVYEELYDQSGRHIKSGDLLFASVEVRGKPVAIYRFDKSDKDGADYYDADGHAVRRSLMRTPINGARLSSRFGRRKHPVLGYTHVHKGMDFAAPTGTPVLAAGDGVVVSRKRAGGYGNYLRIRHNSTYDTAYAHLSKFARNVRVGTRVKQGQVVAYVGTTGRSTGPHLHYEVLKNGKQINPMNITVAPATKLQGELLQKFKMQKKKIDALRQQG